MANNFGKGIKVTSGFDLSAQAPLDNRTVVDTLLERDAHVSNNRAYEGLRVFVVSERKEYLYDGTGWVEAGGMTDEQVSQLVTAYAHSMTEHVSKEAVDDELESMNKKIANLPTKEMVNSKSDVGHDHDDKYYSMDDIDQKLLEIVAGGVIDLESYAKKADVEAAIASKAELGHGHSVSEIDGLNEALEEKANLSDVATKEEVQSKADATHNHNNDYYTKNQVDERITSAVTDGKVDLSNYATISDLASKADASHMHTVSDIEGLTGNIYTKEEIDNKIDLVNEAIESKSDAGHNHNDVYYTQQQVDQAIANAMLEGEVDLSGYATKVDLTAKADVGHNHNDVYATIQHEHTVEELSDLFDNVYSDDEIDVLLSSKADAVHNHDSDYYNKETVDEKIAQVLTDGELNLEGYATKTDLATKADIGHGHTPSDIEGLDDLFDNSYSKKEVDDAIAFAKTEAMAHADTEIANLVDSAPDAMNTLNELANAIEQHQEVYEAYIETISTQMAGKSDSSHVHNELYYTKEQVQQLIDTGIGGVDLSNLVLKSEMQEGLDGKSDLGHGHEITEISNLREELDAKMGKEDAVSKEELEAIENSLSGKADAGHVHDIYANQDHEHTAEDITDLSEHYYTKNAMDTALSGKSDSGHNHNSDYYTKNEVDNKIQAGITDADLNQYATVTYVTNELQKKADIAHAHTVSDIENLQEELDAKADKANTATKDDLSGFSPSNHNHNEIYYTQAQVDERIQSGISGVDLSVFATKADLALKAEVDHIHDYANSEHEHAAKDITDLFDHVYNKKEMDDALSSKSGADHVHGFEEITGLQEELEAKANKADTPTNKDLEDGLAAKAEAGHRHDDIYYTKESVDERIQAGINGVDLSGFATKADLALKADGNHNHDDVYAPIQHNHGLDELEGLGDNFYNKNEMDVLLADKSDIGHGHDNYASLTHEHTTEHITDLFDKVYNKTDVDDALSKKAASDHNHNDIYAPIQHSHGLDELEGLGDSYYNKDELDGFLANKSDIDHKHNDYASLTHEHTTEQITDLFNKVYNKTEIDDALSKKAASDHNHNDVYAPIQHTHELEELEGLEDNFYSKNETDNLLTGYSPIEHSHNMEEIGGLQNALELKADKATTATKEDLQTALNNKTDVGHRHDDDYANIVHDHNDLYYTEEETEVKLEEAVGEAVSQATTEANEYTERRILELLGGEDGGTNTLAGLTLRLQEHEKEFEDYKTEVAEDLANKSDAVHIHDISDIVNLEGLLDRKADKTELEQSVQDLQNAIDNAITSSETSAINYVNQKLAELINGAPESMDTLNELAQAIQENQGVYDAYVATITDALAKKADANHVHDDRYYLKYQVDVKFANLGIDKYATLENLQTWADLFALKGHTHEGLNATISMEMTELDTLLKGVFGIGLTPR